MKYKNSDMVFKLVIIDNIIDSQPLIQNLLGIIWKVESQTKLNPDLAQIQISIYIRNQKQG